MVATFERPPDILRVDQTGRLQFDFHYGQSEAWECDERFILILAGLQSGKTSFGPPWLMREMQRKGPGDYLVVSPTFTLLELKALPEFKRLFETVLKWGEYKASPVRVFELNRKGENDLWGGPQTVPTRVLFAHAQDPDSIESATALGAWLDEAGQKKFKRDSWVSIQGRLALTGGRVLFTTTAYTLGWLKSELYDPWQKSRQAGKRHPTIAVVRFDSTANPRFPRDEFKRVREILPRWLFNMRYRGMFERPAGMIYDCFRPGVNTCPPFAIPDNWPRFLGLDFGGNNTAGVFVADELDAEGNPTGRMFVYRDYLEGGRTATQHARAMIQGEPKTPTAVGGSKSEGQWRNEFGAGGLGVWPPPFSDVEIGILKVYEAFQTGRLVIFNTLLDLISDVQDYSRVLDDNGDPTEKIEDKETYHRLDGLRYIVAWKMQMGGGSLMR